MTRADHRTGPPSPACRRTIPGFVLTFAAVLASGVGCTHDLDALRSGSEGGGGAGGEGGSGATGGGGGGTDAGAGGTGAGTGGADAGGGSGGTSAALSNACEPCTMLPMFAQDLGLSRCCRGAGNEECGVSLDDGALCIAPMLEGRNDAMCPDAVGPMDTMLPGCCRPDGYCGLSLAAIDLGCIRRDQFPDSNLGGGEPIMCRFPCSGDSQCREVPDHICVEDQADPDPAPRFCAHDCDHDGDCEDGLVCAITNNEAADRVDSYCQAPIGALGPGSVCDSPTDCRHGLCASLGGSAGANTCAELCGGPADCPADRPVCFPGKILIPSKKDTPPDQQTQDDFQQFGICAPSM